MAYSEPPRRSVDPTLGTILIALAGLFGADRAGWIDVAGLAKDEPVAFAFAVLIGAMGYALSWMEHEMRRTRKRCDGEIGDTRSDFKAALEAVREEREAMLTELRDEWAAERERYEADLDRERSDLHDVRSDMDRIRERHAQENREISAEVRVLARLVAERVSGA